MNEMGNGTPGRPQSRLRADEPGPIRVVVIDAHPVVRAGVRRTLEQDPSMHVLGEAANTQTALALMCWHRPHVVVMDLISAESREVEKIRQVRTQAPGVDVLVLTSQIDDAAVAGALAAGALGYLHKSAPLAEILKAVRHVSHGRHALDPTIAERIAARYGPAQAGQMPGGKATSAPLSARERDVLVEVAAGRTNREIGLALGISERTVHSHLVRTFAKLKVGSRVAAVMEAARLGWIQLRDAREQQDGK